jgi:hypothetical protein
MFTSGLNKNENKHHEIAETLPSKQKLSSEDLIDAILREQWDKTKVRKNSYNSKNGIMLDKDQEIDIPIDAFEDPRKQQSVFIDLKGIESDD